MRDWEISECYDPNMYTIAIKTKNIHLVYVNIALGYVKLNVWC